MTSQRRISYELIERHRNINVEHVEWWDNVEDYVKEEQVEFGVEVKHVYFSGFWSQGDGACFEGSVFDFTKFIEKHGLAAKFPWIMKLRERGGGITLSFRHQGHYSHSGCVAWDFDYDTFERVMEPDDPVTESIVQVWDGLLEKEAQDFEKEVRKILTDAMDDEYRKLKEDYNYLTSDEAVRETLEDNEIYDEEDEDELSIC